MFGGAPAMAASAAAYFRPCSASDRHSSITPSSVAGRNGLRRHRVAPRLSAILKQAGSSASGPEKAYPEIAISGTGRRVAMEYPDRLEPPHVRHKDIDDHQIERAVVQRGETALAAIRDRDPEPALLEPYAY